MMYNDIVGELGCIRAIRVKPEEAGLLTLNINATRILHINLGRTC